MRLGSLTISGDAAREMTLMHVRDSPFADYFSCSWVGPAPPVTPAHLWRANHLAAGWQVAEVRAFMATAAPRVDDLLARLPSEEPGSPSRSRWFGELVETVRDVTGVGPTRLAKALHPISPRHIPIIDNKALPWAVATWFPQLAWNSMSWRDIYELLDSLWLSQEEDLAAAVEGVSAVVPGRLVSPFGVMDAIIYRGWTKSG